MGALGVLALTLLLFLFKGGICMSVCLHRFAAHAAFKTGPVTAFLLSWVGCMGNQGGPIWWASQHRCHHKFCDQARDPHSAERSGTVAAFAFFTFQCHQDVNEEFAPQHISESMAIRILDTFSGVPVIVELLVAYALGGLPCLWASYTSGWLSQTVTLWFNIINHPPRGHTHACLASDVSGGSALQPPSPF